VCERARRGANGVQSPRKAGAWYRAELAEGPRELGLRIDGGAGKDGRYFEIAGVPERLAERVD
jgi:hypothetical protein